MTDFMTLMSEPVLVLKTNKTISPPEVYDISSDPKGNIFLRV